MKRKYEGHELLGEASGGGGGTWEEGQVEGEASARAMVCAAVCGVRVGWERLWPGQEME
jgi:hypothetical protein